MNKAKAIGSAVEIKVKLAFIELGINVSTPYGDCEKYDFIADLNGDLIRIQCKSARTEDNGRSFIVDFRRKAYLHKQGFSLTYNANDLDYFATYYEGKAYLFPAEECNVKRRFRLAPRLNSCQYASS